jgi:alkylation response protein AidB-like acyl-CoA dehydrogenase
MFELTDEQRMIQLMVREFAREKIAPVAAENDRTGTFPQDIIKQMGQLGLMGMMIDERWGGCGAGAVSYVLALQEIAWACASTAVTMSVNNLTCEPIYRNGTDEQKKLYLEPIASGSGLGAFAITEPDAGTDAGSARLKADLKKDKYILNGAKAFITNGSHATVFLVIARTGGQPGSRGLSAFIVERDTPGLIIGAPEKKMGLRASSTVPLTFEDCAVPAANLLGREGEGFRIAMEALDSGRIGISSQAIGIARAALDEAIDYAKERKQFNRPIARFQAIQWMIADAARDIEAAQWLSLHAAALKEQGKPLTREASIAKLFATEAANRICYDSLQIHGGYGYIQDYKIERLYRDARVTTIYEGTSEVQRIVIANSMLK